MIVGRWVCSVQKCRRMVEYDGNADGLFNFRRQNKKRQWLIFTRGIVDKLVSFTIAARSTYTAATRHLAADVRSFSLRRQDVVKMGTAAVRTFVVPPESARCPICGPNPEFIVIDGQALGCSDPDDVNPVRPTMNCPVLDMPAPKLCVLPGAPLRAAIDKVLRGSTPLTATQECLLRDWAGTVRPIGRHSPGSAGALVFFRFFPLGDARPDGGGAAPPGGRDAAGAGADTSSADDEQADTDGDASRRARKKRKRESTLESAVREDDDGNLVLGGKGRVPKKPTETWRDRTGLCAPNFDEFPRNDDGLWLCVRPFLQAFLTEAVSSIFQSHDEKAVRLLANTLRLSGGSAWRDNTEAVDGVGFVASFIGFVDDNLESDRRLRLAVGELLLRAVDVEKEADELFEKEANKKTNKERGWSNDEYCREWNKRPTPADYQKWRSEQEDLGNVDEDDPLVCFEYFAGLPRVRPGIRDSEAEKRRVGYKGKDKHVADVEGDGDSCNKAFSIKAGLSQGVFNVVCPHVITLGFRCMFRAESVGEALSVVLERFPTLPKVIFYDVACKLDKNAMRRVRVIIRDHDVRCLLDRPHSITHSCSPCYMPDESLGKTAGVTTQAAEVAHSIAVGNRTSLAYMHPATYMTHRIVQVAFQNIRKMYRLFSGNPKAENDHVPLSPFFHARIADGCTRGATCSCAVAGSSETNAGSAVVSTDVGAAAASTDVGAAAATTVSAAAGDGDGVADAGDAPLVEGPDKLGAAGFARGDHQERRSAGGDEMVADTVVVAVTGRAVAGDEAVAGEAVVNPMVTSPLPRGARGGSTDEGSLDGDGPSESDVQDISDDSDVGELQSAAESVPAVDASALWEGVECGLGVDGKSVDWVKTEPLTKVQREFVFNLTAGIDTARAVRPRNKANTVLLAADFLRLQGERWLNSEVMNSFIALINDKHERLRVAGQLQDVDMPDVDGPANPRSFVFGTYFYSRLVPASGGYDYEGVRRWGTGLRLDLGAVDIILVPINVSGTHWVLVQVNVQDQYILFYDPFGAKDSQGYVDAVRRWLVDELRSKLGNDAVAKWAVDQWEVAMDDDFPRQTDCGSCGVFVLVVAYYLSLGKALTFSQDDIDVLRQRIAIALYLDELDSAAPATVACGVEGP